MLASRALSRVALVLLPDFSDRLQKLAFRMPVWLIETPENRSAASEVSRMRDDWPQIDVILFRGAPVRRDEWLERLRLIDLHSRVLTLEVLGSEMTLPARAALTERGFTKFDETPDGFRARRTRPV